MRAGWAACYKEQVLQRNIWHGRRRRLGGGLRRYRRPPNPRNASPAFVQLQQQIRTIPESGSAHVQEAVLSCWAHPSPGLGRARMGLGQQI